MKKKIISTLLCTAMLTASSVGLIPTSYAAAKTPQYQTNVRQMEKLNRGLIAVKTTADTRGQTVNGVYLSWRLLGDESLENQAFDIYRNGVKIKTTGAHAATCYIDTTGTASHKYKVVKAGASAEEVAAEPEVTPIATNHYAKPSEVGNGNSLKNSFTYVDIPIVRPADVKTDSGDWSYYYNLDSDHEGGANDASVGDLDGDGDYEIILKWDPTNSKDTVKSGLSGNVYIDAYEIDPNNTGYKWRIDLGKSIRAGAHDTQMLVYDFDGDGKSEFVTQTAAGSVDSTGRYVTEVGDTEEIRNTDNTNIQLSKGHNIGADFYTVFDGETGKALYTTAGIPLGATNGSDWGDSKLMRAHRFLAAVAYLDGVHPSIVMCRGYYNRAVVRAYTWDGEEMTLQWEHVGASKGADSLYGQGNHNLSVADVDNDGKDEIVYGSAVLDDNGKAIGNTYLGHGDAMHVNDFNNDGVQEVFSVKEDSEGYKNHAANFRVAGSGEILWGKGASGDTGRGVMDNIDDTYAKANPNALALGWTSSHTNVFDLQGTELNAKPSGAGKGSFDNFLVYWDGDLGRELLDANIIQKYDAANGWTKRFYGPSDGYTLTGGSTNNYTKRNYCLVADLWGDWREEIIMAAGKGKDETPVLRIFISTLPTDYRLTTLMHDSQYRMAIAWQNVGYNQPPHTSYYVGSAALATDESGNELNYLAPATAYTNVTYDPPKKVAVTGVSLSEDSVTVEKGKTVNINAIIEPADATKKAVTWTSSDTSVATVENGTIKGISDGSATITATTKDGGFTDTCEVSVFSIPVEGLTLSDEFVILGINYKKQISAYVTPNNASDKSVKWTTSDPAVATVAADGTITGVNYGKATITATSNDNNEIYASCTVRITPFEEVNANSSDSFVSSTNTSDFSGSATGGSLSLNANTNTVSEFHKDFKVYDKNKATLKFHFTTGGTKDSNSAWDWTGREYNLGVQLLSENGENILDIVQPYRAGGAKTLTSQIGTDAAAGLISGWTAVVDSSGDVQGSAKRWIVTAEFDYDNDVCNMSLVGTDSSWTATNAKYTKSFNLDGKHFKTLKIRTEKQDGSASVTANPNLQDVTYVATSMLWGESESLYEKDTMSESEIAEWTQTNSSTASLTYDSTNGRILYNPTKPATEYNASKKFDIGEDALVTYDVDWHFGLATGRTSVFEYIQFGSNLRIGWTSGYFTLVSTDAGATYDGLTDGTVDSAKSIFTGSNTTFTKNVKVVFDTANNKIKSLTFDGNTISAYTDYTLPEGTTFDEISFGLQRGGGTSNWEYPNGIDRISVSQFVETTPDIESIEITNVPDKTEYKEGEKLDTTGLVVEATYEDGSVKEITDYTLSDFDSSVAGEQTITVTSGEKTAVFDVNVTALLSEIVITTAPDKTEYKEGEKLDTTGLVVTAKYDDESEAEITDYTLGEFDSSEKGEHAITVSYASKSTEFNITVAAVLTEIVITTPPAKTEYIEGIDLDTEGLVVTAKYDDGSEVPVTDYELSGFDKNTISEQTVTVTYASKTATFDVNVIAKSLTEIVVTTPPAKTEYIEGIDFDATGLVVTAKYDNGTEEAVTDYELSGFDKNTVAPQTITVTYEGKTTTFDVTVVAKSLTSIKITSAPTKTEYKEGSDIALDGLAVNAVYDNGTEEAITDYTVSGYNPRTVGKQTITVSYDGKTATFDVTVIAKVLESIAVTTPPTNTEVKKGNNIDTTGLVVTATYDNGDVLPVTDYVLSGFDKNTLGTQTVTVTFGGKTATFDVTVIASYVKLNSKNADTNTAEIAYSVIDDTTSATIICAVFDSEGTLVEIQFKPVTITAKKTEFSETITFNSEIENYTLKLFMWSSLNDMKAIADCYTETK